eukprot:3263789-Prymnesium_polylepis.1
MACGLRSADHNAKSKRLQRSHLRRARMGSHSVPNTSEKFGAPARLPRLPRADSTRAALLRALRLPLMLLEARKLMPHTFALHTAAMDRHDCVT